MADIREVNGVLNPGLAQLYPASSWAQDRRGDFLGFTYNGVHSTDLGIVRVSVSDRYSDELLPQFDSVTAKATGRDGTYYFGSNYTQRQFTIEFAFDDVSDVQIRRMRELFGDKQIHPLIFDENPYKVYSAKASSSPTIKTLAFDTSETGQYDKSRVYRGEGTIQMICYYPFARSLYEWLEDYEDHNVENIDEWAEASRIVRGEGYNYNQFETGIYDLSTDITFDPTQGGEIQTQSLDPMPTATSYIIIDDSLVNAQATSYLDLEAWLNGQISAVSADNTGTYIITDSALIDESAQSQGAFVHTYNAGDMPTDWQLSIPAAACAQGGSFGLDSGVGIVVINPFTVVTGDDTIVYNSNTGLLEGYASGVKTDHVYNAAITLQSNFKIPKNTNRINILGFGIESDTVFTGWSIDYKYLYL